MDTTKLAFTDEQKVVMEEAEKESKAAGVINDVLVSLMDAHNEMASTAKLGQGLDPSLASEIQAHLAQHQHAPGLCSNAECDPCRTSRRIVEQEVSQRARRDLVAEMAQAAEWDGCTPEANRVAEALTDYRAAGKPDVEDAGSTGVSISSATG